jgi:hypothetical protein
MPRRKTKYSDKTRITTKGLSGGRRRVIKTKDKKGNKQKLVEVTDRYGNIKKTKVVRRGKNVQGKWGFGGDTGISKRKVKIKKGGDKKTIWTSLTKHGPERVKSLKKTGTMKQKTGEMQLYKKGGKTPKYKKPKTKTYTLFGRTRTVTKGRYGYDGSNRKYKRVRVTKSKSDLSPNDPNYNPTVYKQKRKDSDGKWKTKRIKESKDKRSVKYKLKKTGQKTQKYWEKKYYSGGGRVFGQQYD